MIENSLFYFNFSAQTFCNKLKILQGHTDGIFPKELTELGYIQAKLLGKRLSKVKFNQIYVSDLKRTSQTLEQIINSSEVNQNSEIISTTLVREKNSGILEGKPVGINRIICAVIFI
jgi:broad specificity phosphatase PhoE